MYWVISVSVAVELITHYYRPMSLETISTRLKVAFSFKLVIGIIFITTAKII